MWILKLLAILGKHKLLLVALVSENYQDFVKFMVLATGAKEKVSHPFD